LARTRRLSAGKRGIESHGSSPGQTFAP